MGVGKQCHLCARRNYEASLLRTLDDALRHRLGRPQTATGSNFPGRLGLGLVLGNKLRGVRVRRISESYADTMRGKLHTQHLGTQVVQARTEEAAASESAERLAITLRALEDEERSLADADRLPADGVVASLQGDLAALEARIAKDIEAGRLVRLDDVLKTLGIELPE